MKESDIIGLKYVPLDNSWCINLRTKKDAYIATRKSKNIKYENRNGFIDTPSMSSPMYMEDGTLSNEEYFLNEEPDTEFIITKNPYNTFVGKHLIFEKCFVNVRSLKTNELYRTLYFEDRVIK